MGRLKMMGLCLEVGWVNTYLSRFFWRLQYMDLGSVRWDKKVKRSVDIRVARHAHLGNLPLEIKSKRTCRNFSPGGCH